MKQMEWAERTEQHSKRPLTPMEFIVPQLLAAIGAMPLGPIFVHVTL